MSDDTKTGGAKKGRPSAFAIGKFLFNDKLGGRDSVLKVGAKAPAFELSAHTGETVKLSDYAGQRVLLWFYSAASTPG